MSDVYVANHGTLFLVHAFTDNAREWIAEHVDPEALTWGDAIVVEPRYVYNLVAGMQDDGLEVE